MRRPIPLDTREHITAALVRISRLPHDDWPAILGAAVGEGLITHQRARAMLGLDPLPGSCPRCGCGTKITCLDCGADACARCWACATDNCGQEAIR